MGFVVFNLDVLIFFSVQIHLLRIFLILEAQLVGVGPSAALGRSAEHSGLSHIGGQGVRRHLICIVNAARDDGLVGITFKEVDDDFLSQARNGDHAPIFSSPGMRRAYPA